MTTPNLLLTILSLYILLALLIAFSYLARRRLTLGEWFFWGAVALFLPVFGPFFVISARPGPRTPRRRTHPSLNERNKHETR